MICVCLCVCFCVCRCSNHSGSIEGLGQPQHALSPYWGPYTCRENGFLLFFSLLLIPPFCPTLSTSLYNLTFSIEAPSPCFSLSIYPFSPPSNLTTFSLTLSLPSSLSLSFPPTCFHFFLLLPCACFSFSAAQGSDNVIFQLLSLEKECHSTFNACSPLVL